MDGVTLRRLTYSLLCKITKTLRSALHNPQERATPPYVGDVPSR
jgi:hypothetical protein